MTLVSLFAFLTAIFAMADRCDIIAELSSGVCLYLCSKQAKFLNGRYMSANWDVDKLEAKKDEILSKDLLKFHIKGDLGVPPFE